MKGEINNHIELKYNSTFGASNENTKDSTKNLSQSKDESANHMEGKVTASEAKENVQDDELEDLIETDVFTEVDAGILEGWKRVALTM